MKKMVYVSRPGLSNNECLSYAITFRATVRRNFEPKRTRHVYLRLASNSDVDVLERQNQRIYV